jgi:hypothetical protein
MVATTFLDSAGISRVKSVPLRRLPSWPRRVLALRPASTISALTTGWPHRRRHCTVGDLRVAPDLRRLVSLAANPAGLGRPVIGTGRTASRTSAAAVCCCSGWWSVPPPTVWKSRLRLKSMGRFGGRWGGFCLRGLSVLRGGCPGWSWCPTTHAISLTRLTLRSGSSNSNPEYAVRQLELSVAAESSVDAADTPDQPHRVWHKMSKGAEKDRVMPGTQLRKIALPQPAGETQACSSPCAAGRPYRAARRYRRCRGTRRAVNEREVEPTNPASRNAVKSVFCIPAWYSAAITESPIGYGAEAANSLINSAFPYEVSNKPSGRRYRWPPNSATPPLAPRGLGYER